MGGGSSKLPVDVKVEEDTLTVATMAEISRRIGEASLHRTLLLEGGGTARVLELGAKKIVKINKFLSKNCDKRIAAKSVPRIKKKDVARKKLEVEELKRALMLVETCESKVQHLGTNLRHLTERFVKSQLDAERLHREQRKSMFARASGIGAFQTKPRASGVSLVAESKVHPENLKRCAEQKDDDDEDEDEDDRDILASLRGTHQGEGGGDAASPLERCSTGPPLASVPRGGSQVRELPTQSLSRRNSDIHVHVHRTSTDSQQRPLAIPPGVPLIMGEAIDDETTGDEGGNAGFIGSFDLPYGGDLLGAQNGASDTAAVSSTSPPPTMKSDSGLSEWEEKLKGRLSVEVDFGGDTREFEGGLREKAEAEKKKAAGGGE